MFQLFKKKNHYAWRRVAVILLFKQGDKYLYLKRTHTGAADGFYMFPGGHWDEGEDLLLGACREAKEELGVDIDPKDLIFRLVEPSKTHINFFFEVASYRGTLENKETQKHGDMAFLPIDASDIHPTIRQEIELIEKGICFVARHKRNEDSDF